MNQFYLISFALPRFAIVVVVVDGGGGINATAAIFMSLSLTRVGSRVLLGYEFTTLTTTTLKKRTLLITGEKRATVQTHSLTHTMQYRAVAAAAGGKEAVARRSCWKAALLSTLFDVEIIFLPQSNNCQFASLGFCQKIAFLSKLPFLLSLPFACKFWVKALSIQAENIYKVNVFFKQV